MTQEKISRRQLLQSGAAATAALAVTPVSSLAAEAKAPAGPAANPLATLRREHPRLIATGASWQQIKERRAKDALLDAFLKRNEAEARAILTVPPVTYQKQGRRLLGVSRTALRRVLLLSLHFHLNGDGALARRAQEEMLAAAAFPDWNPSHFLDVGEMTTALVFGYDWLYDQLDAPARKAIRDAIVEKGLKAGVKTQGWARSTNNWNQVCLAGMTLGALAVAEDEPALAAQFLELTKNNNQYGLRPYAPDGVYPEGAMYWGYGTSFQTVLLEALQTAIGTDWGLSKSPGFMQSADALLQQLGPSGTYFNFFDGVERIGLESPVWWFARTLKRPDLLRQELQGVKAYAESTRPPQPVTQSDRLLPLVALWWPETPVAGTPPQPLNWYGRGPNPLGIFRSAWNDPQAMYLALKGGRATLSHGHMDAGSFIFEANGVRWGRDLGMQDYYSLESKGVNMWNSAQDGERWKIFRINNFSHSTLTINNQLHRADGHAAITHFSAEGDPGAILDLSPVFKDQAQKVTRGFTFRAGSHALVRDEIEGLKEGDTVRWAMLTKAEVAVSDNGEEAILSEGGQKLRLQLASSVPANFQVISADGPREYDAPNPGFKLVIVNLKTPATGRVNISVTLQPLGQATAAKVEEKLANIELSRWPQAPNK